MFTTAIVPQIFLLSNILLPLVHLMYGQNRDNFLPRNILENSKVINRLLSFYTVSDLASPLFCIVFLATLTITL